jgi:hypothetical protein
LTALDRSLLRVLRGTSASTPLGLTTIIGAMDARERMILTLEELDGGLRRLVAGGLVTEAAPHRFFATRDGTAAGHFSGIAPDEYASAVAEYQRAFARAAAHSEDRDEDPGRPLVTVHWRAADGRELSDDDADRVEDLADHIESALPAVAGAEVIGFESGGDGIEILVWGDGSNMDVDTIYAAVLPVVRAFGCPAGSHLVRHYDGGAREVATELV